MVNINNSQSVQNALAAWVWQHPLTELLSAAQLDTATATVTPDAMLNVVLVGFDEVGRTLLSLLPSTLQLVRLSASAEPYPVPVRYWVFGARPQSYADWVERHYPYDQWAPHDPTAYDELPPLAMRHTCCTEVPDTSFFYAALHRMVADPAACTRIVVAHDTPAANAALAARIAEDTARWHADARTDVWAYCAQSDMPEHSAANCIDPHSVAVQTECARLWAMARDRHLCYAVQTASSASALGVDQALRQWDAQAQQKGLANLLACASLRAKLHVMGYDFVGAGDVTALPEKGASRANVGKASVADDFWCRYTHNNPVFYRSFDREGCRQVAYDSAMPTHGLRYTMAVQEHYRWNAFMLLHGYLPAPKDPIQPPPSGARLHPNLTTWQGLSALWRRQTAQEGCERSDNVQWYDYQLLDNVVWLSLRHGLRIVSRSMSR